MDDLLLHPTTKQQLGRFIAKPSHALMLLAPDGSGKQHVAEVLTRTILGIELNKQLRQQPSVIYIEPQNNVISIDVIRELQTKLHLRTVGKSPIRRVVIIEAAHTMTIEAQNALLKMLEEPPEDTIFILTARSNRSVLPTVYSRTQHIELKLPSQSDVSTHFAKQGSSDAKLSSVLRLSGGRLGLTQTLLNDEQDSSIQDNITHVRQILGMSLFHRLQEIDEWLGSSDTLAGRLDALMRMCQAGMSQAIEKENTELTKRWQRYYQSSYNAIDQLQYNPNRKLLLTHLFMQLR